MTKTITVVVRCDISIGYHQMRNFKFITKNHINPANQYNNNNCRNHIKNKEKQINKNVLIGRQTQQDTLYTLRIARRRLFLPSSNLNDKTER